MGNVQRRTQELHQEFERLRLDSQQKLASLQTSLATMNELMARTQQAIEKSWVTLDRLSRLHVPPREVVHRSRPE